DSERQEILPHDVLAFGDHVSGYRSTYNHVSVVNEVSDVGFCQHILVTPLVLPLAPETLRRPEPQPASVKSMTQGELQSGEGIGNTNDLRQRSLRPWVPSP